MRCKAVMVGVLAVFDDMVKENREEEFLSLR
jgi:hypothetical protein